MTLKSDEIANLWAQISRLESDTQDLQDSLSAQRQQNEGAWASASTKESIKQEVGIVGPQNKSLISLTAYEKKHRVGK